MPLRPAAAGRPPWMPKFVSEPSCSIWKIPTEPPAALSEYRKAPSALIAISRLVAPDGFKPTTVPGNAVSAPFAPIAKPEIDEVPAFEAYTKRPSGVTAFQQFAAPKVGTAGLIANSLLSVWIAYEEIVELFGPGPPVSDTMTAPLGEKIAANVPRPTAGLTVMADSRPSARTRNTSMLLVARSVTTR